MSDDLDRIMAVMDAAFDPAFGEAWTRRQVGDALIVPGINYLLASARGFSLTRTVLDEEELLLLAVLPEARGRGIGGGLLKQTLDAAQSRGVTRMFLEMRAGNPAESLYLKQGFVATARRRDYYRRGSAGPFDAITFIKGL